MNQPAQFGDELLTRAEAAVRRAGVPAGPTDDVMARALAAVEAASLVPSRRLDGARVFRLAVPLAAALVLALGGLLYFGSITPDGPGVAWAEAAVKLEKARTLTYVMTLSGPGERVPVTAKYFLKEPGRMRMESSNGLISIMDGGPQKLLHLDSATKTAYLNRPPQGRPKKGKAAGAKKPTGTFHRSFQVTDRTNAKVDKFEFSGFERLRNLAKGRGEPIGKKRIGEVEAEGFRILQLGSEFTAWVDPESRLPLVIEQTTKVGEREIRTTMSDFVFDPPLDDALFSLKPPEGYKVAEGQLQTLSSEESLVALLRMYAEASGGAFPPKLDDWADYDKKLKTERFKRPGAATDPKFVQLVQTTTRATMFILQHKAKLTYRPEGVKLGEGDKRLLWYKSEGGETYRVIHGNLRVAEAAADELPANAEK